MQKHYNIVSAKDIFISIAEKLPENLMVDAVSAHGLFAIEFISRLNDEQLAELEKATEKQGFPNKSNEKKPVFLEFSTVQEGSSSCPIELKQFSNFDWDKVSKIKINGNTVPFLYSKSSPELNYIQIVFVCS